jgi:UDP-glucose 4-epimerase/UDP-arabinose 4-epimerase
MTQDTTSAGTRRAVLVAGGAGFIGAQTCKALHRAGYLPVTLDNLSKGYEPQVKWGPLHRGRPA